MKFLDALDLSDSLLELLDNEGIDTSFVVIFDKGGFIIKVLEDSYVLKAEHIKTSEHLFNKIKELGFIDVEDIAEHPGNIKFVFSGE